MSLQKLNEEIYLFLSLTEARNDLQVSVDQDILDNGDYEWAAEDAAKRIADELMPEDESIFLFCPSPVFNTNFLKMEIERAVKRMRDPATKSFRVKKISYVKDRDPEDSGYQIDIAI